MKIDFVSDVSCPWCAIGLEALLQALERIDGLPPVELHMQPFELNPRMPPEVQDIAEHLAEKYNMTAEQTARNSEAIRQRGAALGFEFRMERRRRIYNTFDAHRLLHWAGLHGRQLELQRRLLKAHFTDGENPGEHAVLARLAAEAGLDAKQAQQVLASGRYADEVRTQQRHYRALGIYAVPAVIVDDRHLIQGGQPVEVFERALRQIAAASRQAA